MWLSKWSNLFNCPSLYVPIPAFISLPINCHLRQKYQFGVILKTIYQKGAVLKLFTGGSIFICIVPKAGAQLNWELTRGMNLLCQKLCAMSCYTCSGAITFSQHRCRVGAQVLHRMHKKLVRM